MTSEPARRTKSRFGCRTCKTRRVKCDESKPTCEQCAQKGFECPGYSLRWKWSTKHEKHPSLEIRGSKSSTDNMNFSKDHCDEEATAATQQPTVLEAGAQSTLHDQAHVVVTLAVSQDSNVNSDSAQTSNHRSIQSDALRPREGTGQELRTLASNNDQTPMINKYCWQPPETILYDPQLQIDFFSRQICKVLCAYDSHYNPFRIATVSRADVSLLFFSLCRYIITAFLSSSSDSSISSGLTRQNAQTEMLHRLHNEIAELDIARQSKIEEVLMAIIMYGLSTTWDGSNDPSFTHYNAAVSLFHHRYRSRNFELSAFDNQQFFQQSLIYWWMGLCFVTDPTRNFLLQPPGTDDEGNVSLNAAKDGKRAPHPLAGVSPESQFLLGRAGSLVYAQRMRCRAGAFTSLRGIQREYSALEEAKTLEEALLALEILREGDLVDIADPDTPLKDLINTADAYRLSALLLLYHAFPDLLSDRLSWRVDQGAGSHSSEEQRLLWLTALAIHTLDLLCRNSPASGTRSIEQILLIIIAGELRMPSSYTTEQLLDDDHYRLPSLGPAADILTQAEAIPEDTINGLFSDNFPEEEANIEIDALAESTLDENPDRERVSEARSTVLTRLKSIRRILPYRSLGIVEELVFETWRLNDVEGSDKFWMDVMIENGWKILLV